MSTRALFNALLSAPEETEFEVDVATPKEAENLRINLVMRLSAYRRQLEAVLPSDQLPKCLRLDYKENTGTAVISIGPKRGLQVRQVTFRILSVPTISATSETPPNEQS